MPYQSFDGQKGDSNSEAKLSALKIPSDLTGFSVLDIGCNEGFFCKAALERGATKVFGIDLNDELIAAAKLRTPGASFATMSWWDIPNEKFDLIFFLSAIHYEKDQGRLLDFLYDRLTPNGTLVLECGVIENWDVARWIPAQRHDGIVRFPTTRLLFDRLLTKYAAREVGYSVMQSGDPITRIVVHCKRKDSTILVVSGESFAGKSVLARSLARANVPVIHVDYLLGEIFRNERKLNSDIVTFVQENMKNQDVFQLTQRMKAENKLPLLAKYIMTLISSDADLTVVEGYTMLNEDMQGIFKTIAEESGYKIATINL